jgi:hypothetical protein
MRLKPGGVLLLLLIGALIAYFFFKRNLPPTAGSDGTTSTNTTSRNEDSAGGGSANYGDNNRDNNRNNNTATATERREFSYEPQKPVNGTLRGVVEVGATGFNSFVINMDRERRWEIVSKDFGESLAYEGLATTEDIRAGLKKYLSNMFDKGVSKNNMHFVISSGAQKEPKTTTIANELKKMGYVVNLVTPAQEGKYAFRATVPPQFSDNSYLVDIGSGNTKISWDEGGTLRALELPGAKYYEKGTADNAVYDQVRAQASKIPQDKRNVCFVLGGVPFMMAKQSRQGEERYTVLNAPDTYKASDKRMASGLNIYKGLIDGTQTDTFVFDWDANFTIGFLLSLP